MEALASVPDWDANLLSIWLFLAGVTVVAAGALLLLVEF